MLFPELVAGGNALSDSTCFPTSANSCFVALSERSSSVSSTDLLIASCISWFRFEECHVINVRMRMADAVVKPNVIRPRHVPNHDSQLAFPPEEERCCRATSP